jgi:hypothetical protein
MLGSTQPNVLLLAQLHHESFRAEVPRALLWLRMQIAKRQAVVNPENTFFSVKRFIGRKMDEVKEESTQVPYKVSGRPANSDSRLPAPPAPPGLGSGLARAQQALACPSLVVLQVAGPALAFWATSGSPAGQAQKLLFLGGPEGCSSF